VGSLCFVLPPRIFLSLNRAQKRGIAFSGHGTAGPLAVGNKNAAVIFIVSSGPFKSNRTVNI
jgi:hypothetical protein